jgi:hypothetical protein
MKSIFKKILVMKRQDDPIVIVSGLPRSGTSMMMQMLEAGGVPIVTDHIRKADEDNPRGYYEFEKVKKIKEDVSWLEKCHGKVFKIVSALLYYLPDDKKYKVIFMKREMEEMLTSQNVMLQRQGVKHDNVGDKEMAEKFEKHLRKMQDWLRKQSNIEDIYMDFNEVIQNPHENARLVCEFLGGGLDVGKMARVVRKTLYRQRKKDI